LLEELKALIPELPEPGKKETIDYDKILEYVVSEVSKKIDSLEIPKGEKGDTGKRGERGEDGKDAVIDIPAIVESLLQNMPKMSTDKVTVDYLGIKEYIDKQVSKIKVQAPLNRNGGTNSLRQLTDVVLDGLQQDSKGNYILTSATGDSTPTFEKVSKNLDASDATLNYTGDNLTSIVYASGITKTLNYTGDNLTSVVLSGSTPAGIDLTKTLTYTGDNLTGVNYS
jgi:hypothetical protein